MQNEMRFTARQVSTHIVVDRHDGHAVELEQVFDERLVLARDAEADVEAVVEHGALVACHVQIEYVALDEARHAKVEVVEERRRLDELGELVARVVDELLVQLDVVIDAVLADDQADHGAQVAGAGADVEKAHVGVQLERLEHARVDARRRDVYEALAPRKVPIGRVSELRQVEEAPIDRAKHTLHALTLDQAALDKVVDELVVVSTA